MMRIVLSPEYAGDPHTERFADTIAARFDTEGTVLYSDRNTVKSFTSERGKLLVVKRFKKLSALQQCIYTFFRKNKAIRAFNNAAALRRRGISTPHEIACIEEYRCGLLRRTYFITEFTDARPIRERLIEPEQFDRELAAAFAEFVAELHRKQILHHDLNPTNVLYTPTEQGYQFSVIDINRVTFGNSKRPLPPKVCFENLTRFTGRMDLFDYVIQRYIAARRWNDDMRIGALRIKARHDKAWRRRKSFLRRLKQGFNPKQSK
jgi:tRNA A-37 threonylcarbamoyl transferase component Bud32